MPDTSILNIVLPILLVSAGVGFLFLAVIGQVGTQVSLSFRRQVAGGLIGGLLVAGGVALYLLSNDAGYILALIRRSNSATSHQQASDSPQHENRPIPTEEPCDSKCDTLTFRVDARKEWQQTALRVRKGEHLHIEVIDGTWTQTEGVADYTPGDGGSYICSGAMEAFHCVELIPDRPQGMLIGRVGDHLFAIGHSADLVIPADGILALRMNDGDNGLYDNDGVLTVEIQRQQ